MSTAASERFDKIAGNFATSEVHAMSPTIKRLHEILAARPPASVCDVACGAGHLALSFAAFASRLVAVDPAPNMLAAVQQLASQRAVAIETVQSPAESVPLQDASFDLVASRLAPHHFRDVQQAVREMRRLAKPGGRVAVIDLEGHPDGATDAFNHQLEMWHDPTHVRSYTAARWRQLFESAELRVENLEPMQTERIGGVTVKRWCEIAASGAEAELRIREALKRADRGTLDRLGIVRGEDDFRVPVRTVIIVGARAR